MTRIVITALGCVIVALVYGQKPVIYTGTISEKVEISSSNGSIRFMEEYNPSISYKLVMKPALIIWTFNNGTKAFGIPLTANVRQTDHKVSQKGETQ